MLPKLFIRIVGVVWLRIVFYGYNCHANNLEIYLTIKYGTKNILYLKLN